MPIANLGPPSSRTLVNQSGPKELTFKVLIINSYAGSLTLAAQGREVLGSYEDEGYGLEVQRANFPGLTYKSRRSEWPAQDLSGVVVLAHPPCAAFSGQNTSANARGTDAKKFQCTVKAGETLNLNPDKK
jgi:hypothetical protein